LKGGTVEDTWTNRNYPVLEAAVRLLDEADPQWVSVHEIAVETGLDEDSVARVLTALHPRYVGEMDQFSGGPGPWTIQSVTVAASIRSERKPKARVWRHGNCPVHHRSPEAAARCRNP
jgi:hypothetical protein